MIRTVLVVTDGSQAAGAAVAAAIELVRSLGNDARLHVASAVNYIGGQSMLTKAPSGAPDLLADQAQEALQLAAAAAFAQGLEVETHLLEGDVVECVLACAQKTGAQVIAAGLRGRGGAFARLKRLVMGSTVGKLVTSTDLPVMVVREPQSGQE